LFLYKKELFARDDPARIDDFEETAAPTYSSVYSVTRDAIKKCSEVMKR
jgi:hypothetical protein